MWTHGKVNEMADQLCENCTDFCFFFHLLFGIHRGLAGLAEAEVLGRAKFAGKVGRHDVLQKGRGAFSVRDKPGNDKTLAVGPVV